MATLLRNSHVNKTHLDLIKLRERYIDRDTEYRERYRERYREIYKERETERERERKRERQRRSAPAEQE